MAKNTKKSKASVRKAVPVKKIAKTLASKAKVGGKGDFFSDAWSGVKNFTKKIIGQGIHKGVDWLSGRAHDAIKGIVGHGDYLMPGAPIGYNSMYAGASVTPKFANSGNANTIQHRESLGVIKSSNAFQRTSLTMNPGLTLFPWISEVAGAWQRYKFHGAIIEWIPAVSPLSVNAGGRVVLSSRYDLSTAPPQSVQEAEVTFGATVGRPMDQMAMPIECKASLNAVNALNVRFGDLPTGANAQFFDHCIVDVCNAGQTDGTSDAGEVFITYEIEFIMPIAEHLSNASVSSCVLYSPITTAEPFGTPGSPSSSWVKRSGNNLPISISTTAATMTVDLDALQPLPIGSTWIASLEVQSLTTVASVITVTLAADLGVYNIYKLSNGADFSQFNTPAGGNSASMDVAFRVRSSTTNQSLLFAGMTLGAATTGYATLTLTPVVSGLSEERMRRRFPELFKLQDSIAGQMSVIQGKLTADEEWTRRMFAKYLKQAKFEDEAKRFLVAPLPPGVVSDDEMH